MDKLGKISSLEFYRQTNSKSFSCSCIDFMNIDPILIIREEIGVL